jgi:hypothetical protein
MRFQKIILYLLLATMAVGCDQFGGFTGCWGCYGFNGCEQWDLTDDHFMKHPSGLPFGMFFSVSGADHFNVYGPSANGTTNSLALAHFGIQHFLSNNLAFRALLSFASDNNGAEGDAEVTSTEFGIGLGLLYYFRPLYNIAPYIGGGVGYRAGSSNGFVSPDNIRVGQFEQQAGGETSTNIFGVTASAGFDWYITRNIAIGSEYALGFSSRGGSTTPSGGSSADLPTSTTFGFAPAGNMHILVHF